MNGHMVNKALDWIVKVAGMVICAPVTWLVAGDLFADVQSAVLRFAIQLSAVLLVEGVLLRNWLQLELDHTAAPEIKARYALTALGMYIGLWVLAWQHGEGAAGIVFRAALGAALIGSGWDTYVTTWQKLTARADKDVTVDGSVRKHRRKLAITDAKAAADAAFTLSAAQREVDTDVKLTALARVKDRQLAAVKQEHQSAMQKLSGSEGFPYPVHRARARATDNRRQNKARALATMLDIYRADPHASLRDVGSQIGRAHQTVSDYLSDMEADGKIHRNGNGIQVLS